jgi:hypothetical protein
MPILDVHEFMPHTSVPGGAAYVLHDWTCTCGARSPQRYRSKTKAEIGWFEHAMPHAPAAPAHRPTLEDGPYDNSLAWACSCGDRDRRGRADERRAMQSHTAHANQETLHWWRTLYEEAYTAMSFEDREEYARQRWHARAAWEDAQRAEKGIDPHIAKMLLDRLI